MTDSADMVYLPRGTDDILDGLLRQVRRIEMDVHKGSDHRIAIMRLGNALNVLIETVRQERREPTAYQPAIPQDDR